MTRKLNITPEAERDIFAISINIKQQDSAQAAKSAVSKLKDQLQKLTELPDSGRAGGCEGTREIVLTGLPFIAIYEKTDTSIMILRVLYGAD
jgi:toxin ParE1/3/4